MTNRRLTFYSSGRQQKKDGYIVIIVLLLTAVLLMLGLSLATRTTEEVYQSGQEADTTRVFNVAETGIEAALYQIEGGTAVGSIVAPTAPAGSFLNVEGEQASKFEVTIPQGEVLTLKWRESTKINWEHNVSNCSGAPAIVVTLYNVTGAVASHLAYDPYNYHTDCKKGTNFVNAPNKYSPPSLGDLGSSVTLVFSSFGYTAASQIHGDSLLRIRPLYADAKFTIENSGATRIVSTATDETGGGEGKETRKIEVIRTEPAAPSIFDYAVFSGGALTK